MALFRSRIDLAAAVEKVFFAVEPRVDPARARAEVAGVSSDRISRERTYVALFAALIAMKFCRKSDWRNNGRDLFTALSTRVLGLQAERSGFGAAVEEVTLADRLQYYNVALEIAAPDLSPERVSAEVGKSFEMLFGKGHDGRLAAIGSKTFVSTFEDIVNITSSYKL